MEREFQVHRTERDYAQAEAWRWLLAFLIGVTMGVLGFLVDWGIGMLNNTKYFTTQRLITSEGQAPTLSTCPQLWGYCCSSGASDEGIMRVVRSRLHACRASMHSE